MDCEEKMGWGVTVCHSSSGKLIGVAIFSDVKLPILLYFF